MRSGRYNLSEKCGKSAASTIVTAMSRFHAIKCAMHFAINAYLPLSRKRKNTQPHPTSTSPLPTNHNRKTFIYNPNTYTKHSVASALSRDATNIVKLQFSPPSRLAPLTICLLPPFSPTTQPHSPNSIPIKIATNTQPV